MLFDLYESKRNPNQQSSPHGSEAIQSANRIRDFPLCLIVLLTYTVPETKGSRFATETAVLRLRLSGHVQMLYLTKRAHISPRFQTLKQLTTIGTIFVTALSHRCEMSSQLPSFTG